MISAGISAPPRTAMRILWLTRLLLLAATKEVLARRLNAAEIERRLQDPAVRRAFEAVGPDSHAERLPPRWTNELRRKLADSRWDNVVSTVDKGRPTTTGRLRVLVSLVAFQDTPASSKWVADLSGRDLSPEYQSGGKTPALPVDVEALDPMDQVDAWYRRRPRGHVRFECTYARVTLSQNHPRPDAATNFFNWCDNGAGTGFTNIMNDALTRAKELGCHSDWNNFDVHVVNFPYVPGCHGAVASTPGSTAWFNGLRRGSYTSRTWRHEFGHLFGLHHSQFHGSDRTQEYGDHSDIMGKGSSHFSPAYQHLMGWLDADRGDVALVRRSGYYRIYPGDMGLRGALSPDGWAKEPSEERHDLPPPAKRLRALVLERHAHPDDTPSYVTDDQYYYAWFRSVGGYKPGDKANMDFSLGLTIHRYMRAPFKHESSTSDPLGFPDSTGSTDSSGGTTHLVAPADPTYAEILATGKSERCLRTTSDSSKQGDLWLGVGQTWANPQALCNLTVVSLDGGDVAVDPHNRTALGIGRAGGRAHDVPASVLVRADCAWPSPHAVRSVTPSSLTLEYTSGTGVLEGEGVRDQDWIAMVPDGVGCRGAAINRARYWEHGSQLPVA
eukprot:g3132.t1